MPSIKFKIVTPEKTVFEEEIYQATLPVKGGIITILSNHIPFIGALNAGEILLKGLKGKSKEEAMAISGGFVEFSGNVLTVLADSAERAEEIDVEKVEKALKRAEEAKKNQVNMDEMEFAKVAAAIERETARLKVAGRYRMKTGIRTGE